MKCAHCSAPITGRKRMYCDRQCGNAAYLARPKPECSVDGCGNPRNAAKGLCKTHYNRTLATRHKPTTVTCVWCGTTKQTTSASAKRKYGFTCSNECRRLITFGNRTELPSDHWARWYGKTCNWKPQSAGETQPSRPVTAFQMGACHDCGAHIVEPTGQTASTYCSEACNNRAKRRRRRAREHNAPGDFRHADVIRQYMKQGKVCAYCKEACDGLPDPEHVLPLSRGGRNDTSNLVAACRACNADKGDLTLTEWAESRAARALPARDTTLTGDAYKHLYLQAPTQVAYRDRHKLAA